jgi:uncharacterized protein YigA (DUF484 family)
MQLTSDDVAEYLKEHSDFFEEYADLLSQIFVPHPHGGRAISITERQIVTLRERSRKLESKLRELIAFGEENDALSEKLHRITLALIPARDVAATLDILAFNLREDFRVPHVALRVWGVAPQQGLAEFSVTDEATRGFAQGLSAPYCAGRAMLDTAAWFGESAPLLRSFAYAPLATDRVFGLLVLGAEDPQRFYPEMGTLYLQRLAEVAAAALARHVAFA